MRHSCLDSLTNKKEAEKELPSPSYKNILFYLKADRWASPEHIHTHALPSENHRQHLKQSLGTCFLWGNMCVTTMCSICMCVWHVTGGNVLCDSCSIIARGNSAQASERERERKKEWENPSNTIFIRLCSDWI